MRGRLAILLTAISLVGLMVPAAGAAASGAAPGGRLVPAPAGAEIVPGSYIVVLNVDHPSAVASEHARRYGAALGFVYEHALSGYSARLSPGAVQAIARDPRVARVEPETIETIQQQSIPTGVDRIETDKNPTISTNGTSAKTVSVPVAVIDTGIAAHADLNVVGRVDCTVLSGGRIFGTYSCAEGQGDDGNGHGTHVAGTVAARDNGVGVVGVAPGAPLWSVKVCPTNSCPSGAIIAGINWVAGKKGTSGTKVDFAAANFSISSADSDNACGDSTNNATHQAICGLVAKGVVFVMAAGNDGRVKVPYPVALSVSAIADFDGKGGATGSPTCRTDEDDTLANFSNYGPKVRIAAPGVCIRSTWTNGGYNTISGTSMAAPHVTGAVALYLHANGKQAATNATGVKTIEDAITGAAHKQGTATNAGGPCSYDDTKLGGPLLFVNGSAFKGDGKCDPSTTDTGGNDSGTTDSGTTDPGTTDPGTTPDQLVLEGTATTSGPWWRPVVTATVTDRAGGGIGGVTVAGTWTGATGSGSGSCLTGSDGTCTIDMGRTKNPGPVTFTSTAPVSGKQETVTP
jgi:subtilisin